VLHHLVLCFVTIVVEVIIIIIIIIIIININLSPLLSIYDLGNLHLSQTVSGIGLREGKDIHSIPQGQGSCPRNLLTIRHVCNNSVFFAVLLRRFWLNLYSLDILRSFW
jgi:hypothetical protein